MNWLSVSIQQNNREGEAWARGLRCAIIDTRYDKGAQSGMMVRRMEDGKWKTNGWEPNLSRTWHSWVWAFEFLFCECKRTIDSFKGVESLTLLALGKLLLTVVRRIDYSGERLFHAAVAGGGILIQSKRPPVSVWSWLAHLTSSRLHFPINKVGMIVFLSEVLLSIMFHVKDLGWRLASSEQWISLYSPCSAPLPPTFGRYLNVLLAPDSQEKYLCFPPFWAILK